MPCRATKDGWVIAKISGKQQQQQQQQQKKHGLLDEEIATHSMNSKKRQKDIIPEDESPRLEGVRYATGEEQRANTNSSRKNEAPDAKLKQQTVVDGSGGESKVQCCKEQYCIGTWKLSP